MYEQGDYKKFIKFKLGTRLNEMIINRIKLFQSLKILKGALFLRLALKRIELSKETFMLIIEQGRQTFLANDLS